MISEKNTVPPTAQAPTLHSNWSDRELRRRHEEGRAHRPQVSDASSAVVLMT